MLDGSTAVWLGLTLAAPLTLVPEIALLRLLHSRRSNWHPLDVLLVSLVVGQLCCTLVALGLSAAALARHAGLSLGHVDSPHHPSQHQTPLCAALVSFWAAAHTLHAATLTSMAVDRAMTVRWPYKYRLSVRRTQVRYHVVVLAIVSVLVGVAALFASSGGHPVLNSTAAPPTSPPRVVEEIVEETTDFLNETAVTMSPERQMMQLTVDMSCTFLPHLFDSRFSYFWICLHGILLIGTLSAGAVVVVTRMVASCCSSGDLLGLAAGSGSDMRTLGHASDGSSATLPCPPRYTPGPCLGGSSVSPGAARSVKPMFGSPDKSFTVQQHEENGPKKGELLPVRRWNRQRHSTVAAVLVVAYTTHHLPLLLLTTLGTFFGHVLPVDWPYSAIVLASSLGSSLLVMAVLVLIDPSVHGWMMESLSPSRRRRRPFPLDRHLHHHHEQESADPNLAPMKIDDEARYRISQIYSSEPAEAKFPLTNGSLFVHLMNPASGDSSGARANRRPSRMGVSAYDQRHQRGSNATTLASQSTHSSVYVENKPPLLTFMSRSKILSLNGLSDASRTEPLYNDPGELQVTDEAMNAAMNAALVSSFADCSTASTVAAGAKFLRNQEPIYASLSETVSSCNTLDSLGARILGEALERDEMAQKKALARERDSEDSDSSDVGSATESAGDDFEFHNIRTSRQTLISSSPGSTMRARSRVARSATYRVLCNGLDVKCTKRGEESGGDTVPSKGVVASESQHGLVTCVTIQADDESSAAVRCSLRKSKLLTSLSMNDIDIIGSESEPSEERNEFSGPVRSDSLFSLCDDSNHRSPQGQHSELELSKLPLDGRRPRKPQRPSIQQHLEQLERRRECGAGLKSSHMRNKSSRRSRAAVLQRFHDRHSNQSDSGFSTRSSTCNGTPTKTVVSIAALKAALSQSPPSYLDNGDVYPSQSKTVFVSEYI